MPKRFYEALLISLLLGSCGEVSTRELAEVADVNARRALSKADSAESDVSDLEDRLSRVEDRLGM